MDLITRDTINLYKHLQMRKLENYNVVAGAEEDGNISSTEQTKKE
jgi:hypothetical protein